MDDPFVTLLLDVGLDCWMVSAGHRSLAFSRRRWVGVVPCSEACLM